MIVDNVVHSIDDEDPELAIAFGENLIKKLKLTRSQVKNTLEPEIRQLEATVHRTLMPPMSRVFLNMKDDDDKLIKLSGLNWEVFKPEGRITESLLAWVNPTIFFPWLFSLEGNQEI